jgi:hypothetical protein
MVRNLFLASFGLTLLLPLVEPGAELLAQDVVLDEGRFALFLEGREVGSESFSIHRLGMGESARILATATVAFDGTEMRPTLEARPDFVVTAYQNEVSGARKGELSVVLNGNRYVSRVSSADGEVQREYRAAPRTAVLEARVSHHYFFVARFIDSGPGPVVALSPLDGTQARLEVVSSEAEPFQLGGERMDVRHVRLQDGGEMRDLWIDDQGRVLRVEIPSLRFRAERLPPS